jgi:O-methyltransferase involved in polyketide biosynthesis
VLVVSEGLIIYFHADGAAELARDLAARSTFRRWVIDLTSPALLKMLQKSIGGPLSDAGSPLTFAPRNGPEFFVPYGWKSAETRSVLHTAAKLKRLSFGMRLLSLLPDPAGRKPNKPWGGVCVLENCGPARAA